MFKQTLRQLAVTNSLVFLAVLISFAAIIYSYLLYSLFDSADARMFQRIQQIGLMSETDLNQFVRSHPGLNHLEQPTLGMSKVLEHRMGKRSLAHDMRILMFLRSSEGRLIPLVPERVLEQAQEISELARKTPPNSLRTVEEDQHVYRILSLPYTGEPFGNPELKDLLRIQDVVVITYVDAEVGLLHRLLIILLTGVLVGTLVIFLAGYLLARRAMIPIRQSWEKQQQFVADASHELRSPLTGISNNAELILRHQQHTVAQESHRLETITKEALRMGNLVTRLLILARADANQTRPIMKQVDLTELAQVATERFAALEEGLGPTLSVSIDPSLQVTGDDERLHQLMVILLDNAFQYTPCSGQVTFTCRREGKQILLSVSDTGTGIAAKDLPHIFDRFYRVDKARSRDYGGTGLGLAIAKTIVADHKGNITVTSTVGEGTTFTVFFPEKT